MPDESAEEPKRARPVAKPGARRRDDDDYDDEDDRPRRRRRRDDEEGDATGGLIPYKNPKALTAYYVGIFGFFLPFIGPILAFVFGIQGLKYAKQHPKARGQAHAIIGIIAGVIVFGIHSLIGLGVVVALLNQPR